METTSVEKELRTDLAKYEEDRINLTRIAPVEQRIDIEQKHLRDPKENLKGKRSNSKHLRQESSPERRRG